MKGGSSDVFLAVIATCDCLLASTLQLESSSPIVLQNDHFAIFGVGKHLELFYGVPKVSCQQDANRNAVSDEYVVAAAVQVKTPPKRVQKRGNTIKHVTCGFTVVESIKERSKSIAVLL